ncbi:MAG: glycosyltransferase family 4 protein [Nitrospiraceae bacterium]|nr:glycosyltransferase family 4 protein [Nitrospiraceae bacterium]
MKIIMISPFAPYPPNSGGRIRQWELIKYLGSRHDLTLVFFINKGEKKILDGAFKNICSRVSTITHQPLPWPMRIYNKVRSKISMITNAGDNILKPTHRSLPWPMRIYDVEPMRRLLKNLSSNNFDLLITEFIYMAHYRDFFDAPAVLHEHNIESSVFKQYSELPDVHNKDIFGIRKNPVFWKASWMHMRDYENNTWPKFDLRITVSKLDQKEMDSRCPDGKTIVAENGVNTVSIKMLPPSKSKKILFVGTMNYFPNIDGALYMAESIMPYIWRTDPSIRLCIAGNNMPKQILDLSSDPRIDIIRDPSDISTVAKNCSVSVVPLRIGGGTRIKILEAFALGLPVVSTSKGCEGLDAEDNLHLMIRDNPEEFAAAVTTVVNDHNLSELLRKNGRNLVESKYDWQNIFKSVEDRILDLTNSGT